MTSNRECRVLQTEAPANEAALTKTIARNNIGGKSSPNVIWWTRKKENTNLLFAIKYRLLTDCLFTFPISRNSLPLPYILYKVQREPLWTNQRYSNTLQLRVKMTTTKAQVMKTTTLQTKSCLSCASNRAFSMRWECYGMSVKDLVGWDWYHSFNPTFLGLY